MPRGAAAGNAEGEGDGLLLFDLGSSGGGRTGGAVVFGWADLAVLLGMLIAGVAPFLGFFGWRREKRNARRLLAPEFEIVITQGTNFD